MVCCVECGAHVKAVVHELGSKIVQLSRCDVCGQTADKYVEYDSRLILLDMLLHRTSVYRHLLCNRAHNRAHGVARTSLLAFGLAVLLCDAYLKQLARMPGERGSSVLAAVDDSSTIPHGGYVGILSFSGRGGVGREAGGWDGVGWDRMGRDGVGWDGMKLGWDRMGLPLLHALIDYCLVCGIATVVGVALLGQQVRQGQPPSVRARSCIHACLHHVLPCSAFCRATSGFVQSPRAFSSPALARASRSCTPSGTTPLLLCMQSSFLCSHATRWPSRHSSGAQHGTLS